MQAKLQQGELGDGHGFWLREPRCRAMWLRKGFLSSFPKVTKVAFPTQVDGQVQSRRNDAQRQVWAAPNLSMLG